MKLLKTCFLLFIVFFSSCNDKNTSIKDFVNLSNAIKEQYAPDKRVVVYDINFKNDANKIIVEGETDSKQAYEILFDSLNKSKYEIINKVRFLPDTVVGNKMFAVANNSVINIRSAPKHSAELGTQGLLGMPLKILDKKGDFYRVQTPDNYISWVDKGGIYSMNKNDFDAWNNRKKVIFTKNFGYVYADKNENSKIVSDITLGGVLKFKGLTNDFFEVEYPDKRTGFVKRGEAVYYESWLMNLISSQENIEKIAKSMEGFPYLWGGTSSKGMDCSGFTKTVYLMNGFIIPRDASQQIFAGKTVDENLTFEGLEKGDLMFFGKKATADKKQRVTHVGIWLGNNKGEFIHAAGNVHLSSINKDESNYDEFNKNRYLGSKRYLGVEDKNIIDLKRKIKL